MWQKAGGGLANSNSCLLARPCSELGPQVLTLGSFWSGAGDQQSWPTVGAVGSEVREQLGMQELSLEVQIGLLTGNTGLTESEPVRSSLGWWFLPSRLPGLALVPS